MRQGLYCLGTLMREAGQGGWWFWLEICRRYGTGSLRRLAEPANRETAGVDL